MLKSLVSKLYSKMPLTTVSRHNFENFHWSIYAIAKRLNGNLHQINNFKLSNKLKNILEILGVFFVYIEHFNFKRLVLIATEM